MAPNFLVTIANFCGNFLAVIWISLHLSTIIDGQTYLVNYSLVHALKSFHSHYKHWAITFDREIVLSHPMSTIPSFWAHWNIDTLFALCTQCYKKTITTCLVTKALIQYKLSGFLIHIGPTLSSFIPEIRNNFLQVKKNDNKLSHGLFLSHGLVVSACISCGYALHTSSCKSCINFILFFKNLPCSSSCNHVNECSTLHII